MIVLDYSLSFQPRLAPPLVVLNNTFGGRGYNLAIKRWILGGVSICINERNVPGKFRKYYSSSRQWAAYHLRDLIFLYGAAVRPDNLNIFTPVDLIVSPLLAVNTSRFRN